MKITKETLKNKIAYANQMLDAEITNSNFSNTNHLKVNGENVFKGTVEECCNFLDGLVQYTLLTR